LVAETRADYIELRKPAQARKNQFASPKTGRQIIDVRLGGNNLPVT
jgi:hypothetical protein